MDAICPISTTREHAMTQRRWISLAFWGTTLTIVAAVVAFALR